MLERNRKIGFIKIRDFWFDKKIFLKSKNTSLLWSNENINHKYFSIMISLDTVYIDLNKDIDELFLDFKKKSCRYEIKKSLKLNFLFKNVDSDIKFKKTYDFFSIFCMKKGILIPKYDEWCQMTIFFVEYNNKIISVSAFISDNKDIIRYKHGASSYEYSCMEFMIFEVMKYAKRNNFIIFDMGGINQKKYPAHYKFKTKFGGEEGKFYCYIKGSNFLINITLKGVECFVKIVFSGNWNKFTNFLNFIKVLK